MHPFVMSACLKVLDQKPSKLLARQQADTEVNVVPSDGNL